jgi:hypothetical protein
VRQEGFHPFHHPITGTLAFDQYDEVVSVTDEFVTACLKLFVQCVEQMVSPMDGFRPLLWGSPPV